MEQLVPGFILPKENDLFSSSKGILEICTPFFKKGNLNFFDFCRVFNDGSMRLLASNPDALHHVCKKGYEFLPKIERTKKNIFHIPATNKKLENYIFDIKERFSIDNILFIVQSQKDCIDIFSFGSAPENKSAFDFYLNNTDLLENFILLFKDKASDLLSLSNRYKVLPPSKLEYAKIVSDTKFNRDKKSSNEFFHEIKLIMHDKILSILYNLKIYLTEKELECLIYTLLGMSAKDIGIKLGLSNRTIEFYFENIKQKMRCNTKSQILKLIYGQELRK